jgi:hypothetical protein
MSASRYDIEIEQGATWSLTLSLKKPNKLPVDLTGYTAKCQIRKTQDEDSDIIAEVTTEVQTPFTSGVIALSISREVTSNLDFNTAFYDLIIKSDDDKVSRIMKGTVTLSPRVTIWDDEIGGSGYSGYSGYSG